MKNYFLGNLSRFHLWVDVLLLNGSYLVAGSVLSDSPVLFQDHHYLNLLLLTNLVWICCGALFRLYRFNSGSYNSLNQLGKLLVTYDLHLILLELLLYLRDGKIGPRENLAFLAFEIFALSSVGVHLVITLLIRYLRKSTRHINRYAIIGSSDPGKWVAHFRNDQREMGYRFCGTFSMEGQDQPLASLESYIEREKLDFLYCSLSELSNEQLSKVLRLAERKRTQIRLIPDFYGFRKSRVNFDLASSYPAFYVSATSLPSGNAPVLRRFSGMARSLTGKRK